MTRNIICILLISALCCFCEEDRYTVIRAPRKIEVNFGNLLDVEPYPFTPTEEEINGALHSGAKTDFTLYVVDDGGQPVEDATAEISFIMHDTENKHVKLKTDRGGKVHVEGKCSTSVEIRMVKNGWYTCERIKFCFIGSRQGSIVYALQDGKWQPYGFSYRITLRKVKNPITMFQSRCSHEAFPVDTPFGFDLFTGDFVSPNGKGRTADFYLTYGRKENEEEKVETLTMTFPNKMDGVYRAKRHHASYLFTDYEASSDNAMYKDRIEFHRKVKRSITIGHGGEPCRDEETVLDDNIGQDEYLVLRTRTIVDKYGRHVSSHYSWMSNGSTDGIHFRDGLVEFEYKANPYLNDRNLEAREGCRPCVIELRNRELMFDGIDRGLSELIFPNYFKDEERRKCLMLFLDDAESAYLLPSVISVCNRYDIKPQLIVRMKNQKQGESK